MMRNKKKKVFVGMSGGVDSSVAAVLLKKQGYEVVGVFIKVWEPSGEFSRICTWREDRRDAMRVTTRLDIPLLTIDLSREYKRLVVDYLIAEYRAGRTPNPDVECNREIKFGAFFRWAMENGADYVATGHYARLQSEAAFPAHGQRGKFATKAASDFRLLQAVDKNKDQSYFLWTLTQVQLAYCLFPIGDYTKPEVRRLAKKFGLPNAEKKDSQGLCFVGQLDIKEFLKEFIKPERGKVIGEEGKALGWHDGAWFYTIGERHGFRVNSGGPYYVIAKDIEKNILTVSPKPPAINGDSKTGVILTGVNWISGQKPLAGKTYLARIRHRGERTPCRLEFSAKTVSVRPQHNKMIAVAPGQSLVLYDDEELLGGGVIFKLVPG